MRKAVTLVAACAFATGIVSAQMKKPQSQPAPQPATGTSTLKVTGPNATQAKPAPQVTVEQARRITTTEALKLQNKGEAVIVDVRSHGQFTLGHIKGAMSIPGSQLMARLRELPPKKLIITYCACSAEQSSGHAVVDLNNHGITHAAAMTGGWNEWKAKGYPTATGPQ